MIKETTEAKIVGSAGAVSGAASILGSWQVCHSVCLGIVALLGLLGITVIGMPLAFLTEWAIPLWSIAFALLLVTIGFYLKKRCISSRLIMVNSGLLVAGIPFPMMQNYSPYFWIVGGFIVLSGIVLWLKDRVDKRHGRCRHEHK